METKIVNQETRYHAINEAKLARRLAERIQDHAKLAEKYALTGKVLKDMTEAFNAVRKERDMYAQKWRDVTEANDRLNETVRSLRASLQEALK